MITVITYEGDKENDLIFDAKSDFWIGIRKSKGSETSFITQSPKVRNLLQKIFRATYLLGFRLRFFNTKNYVFGINMGPEFGQFFPNALRGDSPIVYMMDAWPNYHKRIDQAIHTLGIKVVFFSSRQVADIYKNKGILDHSIWLPEAIRIEKYLQKPIVQRDIDVLNFGRKWDQHHVKITDALEKGKYCYLYERIKGQLVLPDRKSFLDALSRAKITICVPSCITHPERSGDICTITMRYFQCMASKTLILGHAPEELIDLFGYNPIIEIEMDRASEQIIDLLENYSSYFDLIEKNYHEIANKHTWEKRWEHISNFIETNY